MPDRHRRRFATPGTAPPSGPARAVALRPPDLAPYAAAGGPVARSNPLTTCVVAGAHELHVDDGAVAVRCVDEDDALSAAILLAEFHSPKVRVSVTKLGVLREAKRVGVCIERSGNPGQ